MKRSSILLTALSVFFSLTVLPAWAQHGRGGGGGRPSTPPAAGSHGSDRGSRPDIRPSTSQPMQERKTPGDLLAQNTRLSSNLQGLLPASTNLQQAAGGFKNLGQFVAAVHVAHNLGIPFDQLKTTMTGPPARSLGQAIHQLKPDVDARAPARKAQAQARKDMRESKS